MTAAIHEEQDLEGVAPIIADLSDHSQYAQMVVLARVITQHIMAMPLEGVAKMADDAAKMALVKGVPAEALAALRIDRDTVQVLACAQKQLQKIRERGER